MLNIKVLGAGCEACDWVEQQTVAALERLAEEVPGREPEPYRRALEERALLDAALGEGRIISYSGRIYYLFWEKFYEILADIRGRWRRGRPLTEKQRRLLMKCLKTLEKKDILKVCECPSCGTLVARRVIGGFLSGVECPWCGHRMEREKLRRG